VKLAQDLFDTMDAYEGLGLAGPQVGVAKRIFVLCEPKGPKMCLVNPNIIEASGSEYGEEGCLSLPKVYAQVPRATRVKVRALDVHGNSHEFEAEDLLARIIQHENDHLDGIMFLEHVDLLTRQEKLHEWKETRGRMMAALRGG
jgi:peptide deformylase